MSLFQCSRCGVIENTALTFGQAHTLGFMFSDDPDLARQAKELLGLRPEDDFGNYCSACCPVRFELPYPGAPTADEKLVIGFGEWHGKFERKCYPLGTMITNRDGNVESKSNGIDVVIAQYGKGVYKIHDAAPFVPKPFTGKLKPKPKRGASLVSRYHKMHTDLRLSPYEATSISNSLAATPSRKFKERLRKEQERKDAKRKRFLERHKA